MEYPSTMNTKHYFMYKLRFSSLQVACAVLGAIATFAVAPVAAEKADRNKQMVIDAGKAEFDETTQTRVLTGSVVITKGTLSIRADKVTIKEDAQGFAFVVATGKLANFRQKREGLDQYMDGAAERIDYDGKAETVKLIQRAQLKRLEKEKVADEVYGAQINYDSKTEFYSVESGAGGQTSQNPSGRVRIVLQPKNADASPEPGKPAEAKK
jgi:lipopolysaccharide export system protein LptA